MGAEVKELKAAALKTKTDDADAFATCAKKKDAKTNCQLACYDLLVADAAYAQYANVSSFPWWAWIIIGCGAGCILLLIIMKWKKMMCFKAKEFNDDDLYEAFVDSEQ